MKKTAPNVESEIVSMIIEGKLSYAQIFAQTGVAVSTIKKIKNRNKTTISHAQELDITKLPLDSLKMIDTRILSELEKSQRNEAALEELIESYREGKISYRQYMKHKRELKVFTVSQLLAIANYAKKRLQLLSK